MNILVLIGILLVILWLLGWAVFEVAGFVVHLLLIIGVILLIVSLFRRAT